MEISASHTGKAVRVHLTNAGALHIHTHTHGIAQAEARKYSSMSNQPVQDCLLYDFKVGLSESNH